ncbi:PUA domain-containing protein [Archaeoglobus fulgidus]|uniref:PUA domain-containing protein n=1 Tax=Archaeoglobus fulgidus TaxID=2234 RepID=UPI000B35DEBE|nr:PUA domain-containing protein [Archaeoglobus fulgidus]
MAFRQPNTKELKVIRKALSYYGSGDFLSHYALLVKEGEKKEVYAVSKELYGVIGELNPHYAGVKIGEVGRRFRFSLEGTFWLLRNSRNRVWVNERGEMLFLYGRDIFAGSVERASEFGENSIVFVCNRFDDVLGIGRSRHSSDALSNLPEDKVFVENLVDRGEYLRHQKTYLSF